MAAELSGLIVDSGSRRVHDRFDRAHRRCLLRVTFRRNTFSPSGALNRSRNSSALSLSASDLYAMFRSARVNKRVCAGSIVCRDRNRVNRRELPLLQADAGPLADRTMERRQKRSCRRERVRLCGVAQARQEGIDAPEQRVGVLVEFAGRDQDVIGQSARLVGGLACARHIA